MLMVIMGAGASFDSAASHPIVPDRASYGAAYSEFRPPLANDLFDRREIFRAALTRYPYLAHVTTKLRNRADGKSVEEVLQSLSEIRDLNSIIPHELLAVRYYLRDVIGLCSSKWLEEVDGITNQKQLVQDITSAIGFSRDQGWPERVLFVTFNYDSLIEDALAQFGFQVTNIDSYFRQSPHFALYKLHGSYNWARFFDTSRISMMSLKSRASRKDIMEIVATRPDSVHSSFVILDDFDKDYIKGEDYSPLIPALALPLNHKDKFECPPDHVAHLTEQVEKVDKILTIGWKGAEKDFIHLLQKQLKSLKALYVVAGEDINTVAHKLKTDLKDKIEAENVHLFGKGFTSFLRGNDIERLCKL